MSESVLEDESGGVTMGVSRAESGYTKGMKECALCECEYKRMCSA